MDLPRLYANVSVTQKAPRRSNLYHLPVLSPVTVGSVITRFGYLILVKMNRLAVAETLLLSHQFSFGINGGVQQIILGITLSLQLNPLFVEIDMDLANAHFQLPRQDRGGARK